jgi:hypothetical protein
LLQQIEGGSLFPTPLDISLTAEVSEQRSEVIDKKRWVLQRDSHGAGYHLGRGRHCNDLEEVVSKLRSIDISHPSWESPALKVVRGIFSASSHRPESIMLMQDWPYMSVYQDGLLQASSFSSHHLHIPYSLSVQYSTKEIVLGLLANDLEGS